MVLALLRRPREAVNAQREAQIIASKPVPDNGRRQGRSGRKPAINQLQIGIYHGLGDCLLLTDQPQLALEFLPLDSRADAQTGAQQRLRALALFRSGKQDDALSSIGDDKLESRLLHLYLTIQSKDKKAANQAAASVFAYLDSLPKNSFGTGQLFRPEEEGYSLREPYAQTLQWLLDHYPQQTKSLGYCLPTPRVVRQISFPQHSGYWVSSMPRQSRERARAQIERLKEAVMQSRANDERWQAREKLSRALAYAGQFAQAAAILRANLREMPPQVLNDYYYSPTFQTAIDWSLLRRRADTELLFRTQSAQLAGTRVILERIEAENKKLDENDIQFDQTPANADVQQLASLGPGVLSPVWNRLGPLVLGGRDRRLLWSVVAQIGSIQDMPVVIKAFGNVTGEYSAPDADVAAIEACLSALSGAPMPTGTNKEKRAFWAQWWQNNATRVIENAQG